MNFITIERIDWQYPVITEKYAYERVLNDHELNKLDLNYFAIPWATIIDLYNKNFKGKQSLKSYIESLNILQNVDKTIPSFTVIQTYHYKSLLDTFKALNIKTVFCPHVTKEEKKTILRENGIEIMPFQLYPVQECVPNRNKDLLYSFVGMVKYSDYSTNNKEVTKLRTKILKLDHPSNTIVKARDHWHYNDVVYKHQVHGQSLSKEDIDTEKANSNDFRDILERSRFSLCPRGIGPNSIRLWESLGAGAIPVLISDDLCLPEIGINWDTCILKIKEEELEK